MVYTLAPAPAPEDSVEVVAKVLALLGSGLASAAAAAAAATLTCGLVQPSATSVRARTFSVAPARTLATRSGTRGGRLLAAVLPGENGATAKSSPKPSSQSPSLGVVVTLVIPGLAILIAVSLASAALRRPRRPPTRPRANYTRSPARLLLERPGVHFEDVAGIDEVSDEFEEIVDFLKFPDRFMQVGARIPRGVLLAGPPGSGKTLLCRALAGEAAVPFLSVAGSEFTEMFVGVGAARVRDLFAQARLNSPCIVFIDEIDAVGRRRSLSAGNGRDERDHTLNQLLVELDGFETRDHVIVVGATNRPDVLDPALLRPGRFDRKLCLHNADREGREAILRVHAHNKPLQADVDLRRLAGQTSGFSGAELANLLNEAAITAARRADAAIAKEDIDEALARVVAGPRSGRRLGDGERLVVAYHEVGHALVMRELPGCDAPSRVSVESRGAALGWTMPLPEQDPVLTSRSQLEDRLAAVLAGRVAEEILLGEGNVTTGASDDIARASELARRMVTEWGMSTALGPLALAFGRSAPQGLGIEMAIHSQDLSAQIDREVKQEVEAARGRARAILRRRRPQLHALAERLRRVETLDAREIDAALDGIGRPVPLRPAQRDEQELGRRTASTAGD